MSPSSLLVRALGAAALTLTLAGSTAQAYPKSCADVYLQSFRGGYLQDGDYVIEPSPGTVFTVYCKGLTTGAPRDYLTLQSVGPDVNFSQISAGGAFAGTHVRTTFTRIRLDPTTLQVDIADLTFATSTGALTQVCCGSSANTLSMTSVAYGVAGGCAGTGRANGVANIDLTGTPFEVAGVFASEGYYPAGTLNGAPLPANLLTFMASGKILNLTGGGYCGATGPDGFNSSVNHWLFASYGPYSPKPALKLVFVGQ